jgi:hypothetical protein
MNYFYFYLAGRTSYRNVSNEIFGLFVAYVRSYVYHSCIVNCVFEQMELDITSNQSSRTIEIIFSNHIEIGKV